jgi:hypothetical protein
MKRVYNSKLFTTRCSLLRRHLVVHILYNYFACKPIFPANLKAMPVDEASRAAIFTYLALKNS